MKCSSVETSTSFTSYLKTLFYSKKSVAVFEAKNGKTKHNLKCTLISEVSKLQFFLQVTEKPYSTLGNQLRCLTQKLAKQNAT